jgi:hypothetical protein
LKYATKGQVTRLNVITQSTLLEPTNIIACSINWQKINSIAEKYLAYKAILNDLVDTFLEL